MGLVYVFQGKRVPNHLETKINRNKVPIKRTHVFSCLCFSCVSGEFKDVFKEILIVSRNDLWITNRIQTSVFPYLCFFIIIYSLHCSVGSHLPLSLWCLWPALFFGAPRCEFNQIQLDVWL
jgi:hypothetical protein